MNYLYIAIAVVLLVLLFSFLSKIIFYVAIAALVYGLYWVWKNDKVDFIVTYIKDKLK